MRLTIDIECECEERPRCIGSVPTIDAFITTDVTFDSVKFETSKSEPLRHPFKMVEKEMKILSTIGNKLLRIIEKVEAEYDCEETATSPGCNR